MTIKQAETLRMIRDVFEWVPPDGIVVTVGGQTNGDAKVKIVVMKPDCGCMAIVVSEGSKGYDSTVLYRKLNEAAQEIRDRHSESPSGFAKHTQPHRN